MKRVYGVFALASVFASASFAAARVDFATTPSGALLMIDGCDSGRTPATVYDLEPGRHRFTFRLDGYADHDGYFEVVPERAETIDIHLERECGILLLRSRPAGAVIEIDDITVGVTPRIITDLAANESHRIRLSKADYRTSTLEVRFNGRTPVVRTERLQSELGELLIETDPAGAKVRVNGIDRGISPLTVTDVRKGDNEVRLALDGYEDVVREVVVSQSTGSVLKVTLDRVKVESRFESVPSGASFSIDGQFRGKGPLTLTDLADGEHVVRAELTGYGTVERTISVAPGAVVRENFILTNMMGRIEVKTSPANATVILDGRIVGKTVESPDGEAEYSRIFAIEDVIEGEHSLIVRKDGFGEVSRKVNVQSRKTSRQHHVALKAAFIPDILIVTDGGEYSGILKKNNPEYVTVEVRPGVEREFRRADIRRLEALRAGK